METSNQRQEFLYQRLTKNQWEILPLHTTQVAKWTKEDVLELFSDRMMVARKAEEKRTPFLLPLVEILVCRKEVEHQEISRLLTAHFSRLCHVHGPHFWEVLWEGFFVSKKSSIPDRPMNRRRRGASFLLYGVLHGRCKTWEVSVLIRIHQQT